MRLAWFTPWPPQRSGIAGRSAELVAALAARGHGIDVFVDERDVPVARSIDAAAPSDGVIRVQSAHEFVWRQGRGQFDLAVYQIGNSRLHQFIWPYLFRWPGLTVLHDARLHHARGRALLASRRPDVYRAEFAWNHPETSGDAAELGVRGFDGVYYYAWPMVRSVLAASRLTVTHTLGGARELAETWPDYPIEYVPLGEGRDRLLDSDVRQRLRAELGWSPATVGFGVFGALTAEKRVPQVLRAFATTLGRVPAARLLLVGTLDPEVDYAELVRSLGLTRVVTVVAEPGDDRFDDLIASVDVSLNLRWPTAVEMSGPWLRALAAGRPTVVLDLMQHQGLRMLDPRSWHTTGPGGADPVAVAIDIVDEDHSLRLAMHRLAEDGGLRHRLGQAARQYWERTHTVPHMMTSYEQVLARAGSLPSPASSLPYGLRPDALETTRAMVSSVDRSACVFD